MAKPLSVLSFEQLSNIIPGCEKKLDQQTGKSVIYIISAIDDNLREKVGASAFGEALCKIINQIRVSLKINSFKGVIPDDCQKESIPSTLSTLVSMLINGDYPGKESMSQTILTISQIIVHKFCKNLPSNQLNAIQNIEKLQFHSTLV